VLRAQRFTGAGVYQHFSLFALVSSRRDSGSARTEADLLVTHLRYWDSVLAPRLGRRMQVAYTIIDSSVMRERWHDTVAPQLPDLQCTEDPERTSAIGYYYRSAAFKIMIHPHGGAGPDGVELGDGGFTSWTSQLMADAKERCLISCISVDRLAALLADG
jgi:hypothetical protein